MVSNLSEAIREVETKEKNNPIINKIPISRKIEYLYNWSEFNDENIKIRDTPINT